MPRIDHPIEALQRAFHECALVGITFETAMDHPALSVAIRCLADGIARRAARGAIAAPDHPAPATEAFVRRPPSKKFNAAFDIRRAQANDSSD